MQVRLLFVILTMFLGGCLKTPELISGTLLNKVSVEQDQRYQYSQELIAKKHYYDAQLQLEILNLIYPNSPVVKQDLDDISQLINKRVIDLYGQLESTQSAQEEKKALLQILALRPYEDKAFDMLQSLEKRASINELKSGTSMRRIIKKPDTKQTKNKKPKVDPQEEFSDAAKSLLAKSEHLAIVKLSDEFLFKHSKNKSALRYKADACLALARQFRSQQNMSEAIKYYECSIDAGVENSEDVELTLQSIKDESSQKYYERGVKLFNVNLQDAIEMFKQSLQYKPENALARRQLVIAERAYRNLRTIKSSVQ
ncbi:hypothetical protein PN836_006060 [Ningiella sp. W23]|uniref:hypothetical protein n=1 Tax=Ningiella sp. W23 TaxID=3023715 RepID=UPI003758157B